MAPADGGSGGGALTVAVNWLDGELPDKKRFNL